MRWAEGAPEEAPELTSKDVVGEVGEDETEFSIGQSGRGVLGPEVGTE